VRGWVISGRSLRGHGAKGKVTRRDVSGRDGCGDSVDAAARVDRTALSEGGQRTTAVGMEKMLRIYFLQQWFNLSDRRRKMRFYDSNRCGVRAGGVGRRGGADESTILRFRQLAGRQGLTQAIFDRFTGLLEERRLLLRSGTMWTQPSSRRRVRPRTRVRLATER